jgi:chemotaxis family two-component system response regulator Rcp1
MNDLQILLAEDNLGDIWLVREALECHHIPHELHVVRDGDEALAFVAKMGGQDGVPCPDVLLLDLNLPKVDGPDVLAEFRKHPLCANTPVIVVSSSDTQADRARLASLRIARYFRKPSDLEKFMQLGEIVLEVLARKGGASPPAAPPPD